MIRTLSAVEHATPASKPGGLGNEIKGCIWGERVWQKGEVEGTKAMLEAYQAGYRA